MLLQRSYNAQQDRFLRERELLSGIAGNAVAVVSGVIEIQLEGGPWRGLAGIPRTLVHINVMLIGRTQL